MPAPIRRTSCDTSHELSRYAGVYEIVNTVTGDRYIGSSVNMRRRWSAHYCTLQRGRVSGSSILRRAWEKYGAEAFDFRVLLVCEPELTVLYEQICIDLYKPRYNIRKEAHSNRGIKFSDETNRKKGARYWTRQVDGVVGSIASLARHFGVVSGTIAAARVKRGWPLDAAVKTPPMGYSERGKKGQAVKRTQPPKGKRYTVRGVTGTLRELVEHFGVSNYQRARVQVLRGWSVEDAVTTPADGSSKFKRYKVFGQEMTLKEIERKYGVSPSTVRSRLERGWDIERAVTTPKDQGAGRRKK